MPTLSVFFRKDDVEKWKAIEHKSEFIHNALHWKQDSAILRTPGQAEKFLEDTSAKVIKTKEDAQEAAEAVVYKKTQNWGA